MPKGQLELVFPNGEGNIEFHVNIIGRGLKPTMIAAGVTVRALNGQAAALVDKVSGKPVVGGARYTGLHALRHFYASWCINSKEGWRARAPA